MARRARLADCRLCVFFRPVDMLSEDTLLKARAWVKKHRPGAELLGWCNAYMRPVTYYIGSCPRYRASWDGVKSRMLSEFFPELG